MNKTLTLLKEKSALLKKKKKGFSIMELAVYILIVAILLAVAAYAGSELTESAKVSNAKQEMANIQSACMQYKVWHKDNQYPTGENGLGNLTTKEAIPASDSLDGISHGPFLTSNTRWTESSLLDPWGKPYQIEGGTLKSVGGKSPITLVMDASEEAP